MFCTGEFLCMDYETADTVIRWVTWAMWGVAGVLAVAIWTGKL